MKKLTKKLGMSTLALASVFTLGFASAKSVDSNVQSVETYSLATEEVSNKTKNSTATDTGNDLNFTISSDTYSMIVTGYTINPAGTNSQVVVKFTLPTSWVEAADTLQLAMIETASGTETYVNPNIGTENIDTSSGTNHGSVIIDLDGTTGLENNTEYSYDIYADESATQTMTDVATTKSAGTYIGTISFTTGTTSVSKTSSYDLRVQNSDITSSKLTTDYEMSIKYALTPTGNITTTVDTDLVTPGLQAGTADMRIAIEGYLPTGIVGDNTMDDDGMYTMKIVIDSEKATEDMTIITSERTSTPDSNYVTWDSLTITEGAAHVGTETTWTESNNTAGSAFAAFDTSASDTFTVTVSVSPQDNYQSWTGTGITETTTSTWTEWFELEFTTNDNWVTGQYVDTNYIQPAVAGTISSHSANDWVINSTGVTAIVLASIFGATTIGLGAYIVVNNNKAKKAKAHTSTSHTTK